MVNKDELLSIVDEYDIPKKPVARHVAKKEGLWFRAVHVWIVNHKNQVLVQKRSSKKDMSPGMWEPAIAGHVTSGDNYFTGAVREVREETGLDISKKDLNLLKIYKTKEFKEYRAVFYCKLKAGIEDIRKEEDEVEEIKLLNIKTLKKYLLYQKNDNWIRHDYMKEMFSILN